MTVGAPRRLPPEAKAVVRLVAAQWERGLIVPDDISHLPPGLLEALDIACGAGLVDPKPYLMHGRATCFALTREGWLAWGDLMGVKVVFT